MTFQEFNLLPPDDAKQELLKCCGSETWAKQLMHAFPFQNEALLFNLAGFIWREACEKEDYLEAFSHHPKIGDVKVLEKKFAATKEWSEGEQSSVKSADPAVLQELADKNNEYEMKFGFIFIVCATGKSAPEMLGLLKARLPNDPEIEIGIAVGEQAKITEIRLKKLLQDA